MVNITTTIRITLFIVCFLVIVSHASADVKLPLIFQSNMVVQRGKPIPVWGSADPNEKIELSLNGQSVSVTANKKGKFRAEFAALPAGGPYNIIIKGKNAITLNDVMIGDVWICGGQSNMQWNVSQTGYQEADTNFLRTADVRLFTVQVDTDYMPRDDIKGGEWKKTFFHRHHTIIDQRFEIS